jgi:hypothetical protein
MPLYYLLVIAAMGTGSEDRAADGVWESGDGEGRKWPAVALSAAKVLVRLRFDPTDKIAMTIALGFANLSAE